MDIKATLRLVIALVLLGAVAPSLAWAEGLQHLPMWGSEGKHCYTLEGAKELVVADKKISLLIENEITYNQQIVSLKEMNGINLQQIESLDRTITAYKEENGKLTEQLQQKVLETNEWRRKAETKSPAPWIIAGTSLAVAGGLAIAVAILSNKASNVPSSETNGMRSEFYPAYSTSTAIEFHY